MKNLVTISTTFLAVTLISLSEISEAQCLNCGNGSDSVYLAANSATLPGGTYNFTSFTILSGVTISVTGTTPLIIYCTGPVNIQGILSANGGNGADGITFSTFGVGGIGVAGGANGGNGVYIGSPSPGNNGFGAGAGGAGDGWSGGGGAGYSVTGNNSGGVGGFGGPAYGNNQINPVVGGSGGGGGSGGNSCGSGGGGAGGGIIIITSCSIINIGATGAIRGNGGNGGSDGTGNCGGGGGGSGGSIFLTSDTINNSGTISATGGTGGASNVPGNPYYGTGANGAPGRIRFDHNAYTGAGIVNPAAGFIGQPTSVVSISAQTNVTCNGDTNGTATVNMTGGTPPYSYLWNPTAQATATAVNLSAGVYTVTVTDSLGVSCTASATITEPIPVLVTANQGGAICEGNCATIIVNAGGGNGPPYSYLWTPGNITTPTILVCPDSTTTYTCTVWDVLGCTGSTTTTVTVNPAPVLTLSAQYDTVCVNATVNVLTGSPAGGTHFGISVTGNIFNPSFAGVGIHDVYYAYTDSNGCSDTVSISIYVDPCTGIQSLSEQHFIHVFPNPAYNSILIHSPSPILQVEMVNVAGEIMYSSVVNALQKEMNTSSFAEGIYLLRIKLEEGFVNRSVVVKR